MLKFTKECVWKFKNFHNAKRIVTYSEGEIVSDISPKVEKEMTDANYAVYSDAAGKPAQGSQNIAIETKDILTKPVRKSAKTADDNKSD